MHRFLMSIATVIPTQVGPRSFRRFSFMLLWAIWGITLLPSPSRAQSGFEPGPYFFDDFENSRNLLDNDPVSWRNGVFNAQRSRITSDGDLVIENGSDGSVIGLRNGANTNWLTYEDAVIRTQVRVSDANDDNFAAGIFTRSLSPAVYFGYVNRAGEVVVRESEDLETAWDLARVPAGLDAVTNDILLEMTQRGSELSLTAWELGTVKPAMPQITVTDSTLVTGTLGPYFWTDGTTGDATFRFFEVADVPEPTSLHLLMLGIFGSGCLRGKRTRGKI